MEPPITIEADAIRDEKLKALRAVAIPAVDRVHDSVVRAQYTEGWVAGQRVPAYQDEPGVQPNSRTESYVALLLKIDNWRWAGVPFYVRTGKRLPKRLTEVAMEFHTAPHLPFKPEQTAALEPNALVLHIQPDQGVTLHFGCKVPARGSRCVQCPWTSTTGAPFLGRRLTRMSDRCSTH
jgi:glucose-6-phosphate 1-dehydrogenase